MWFINGSNLFFVIGIFLFLCCNIRGKFDDVIYVIVVIKYWVVGCLDLYFFVLFVNFVKFVVVYVVVF